MADAGALTRTLPHVDDSPFHLLFITHRQEPSGPGSVRWQAGGGNACGLRKGYHKGQGSSSKNLLGGSGSHLLGSAKSSKGLLASSKGKSGKYGPGAHGPVDLGGREMLVGRAVRSRQGGVEFSQF